MTANIITMCSAGTPPGRAVRRQPPDSHPWSAGRRTAAPGLGCVPPSGETPRCPAAVVPPAGWSLPVHAGIPLRAGRLRSAEQGNSLMCEDPEPGADGPFGIPLRETCGEFHDIAGVLVEAAEAGRRPQHAALQEGRDPSGHPGPVAAKQPFRTHNALGGTSADTRLRLGDHSVCERIGEILDRRQPRSQFTGRRRRGGDREQPAHALAQCGRSGSARVELPHHPIGQPRGPLQMILAHLNDAGRAQKGIQHIATVRRSPQPAVQFRHGRVQVRHICLQVRRPLPGAGPLTATTPWPRKVRPTPAGARNQHL